jgi:hypothetical protein
MSNQNHQNQKPVSKANRCVDAMERIHTVLTTEFRDLHPPQVVFILQWLQHHIFLDIDEMVGRKQPAPQPERQPDLFKN